MKILAIVEYLPGSTIHTRALFGRAMRSLSFVRLPGVSATWIAENRFGTLDEARVAVEDQAAQSGVPLHKAYLVECGRMVVIPDGR